MLKELKINDIKIGSRHRQDMGDLTSLAESIRQEGLLQPIGVTERLELVFGERRIRAVRDILKKKIILARIVDVSSILAGEYAENEIRKDFTSSERVAIAKAIEREIGNRQGQRTDRQPVQKIAQVEPDRKTRDSAAEQAGFGNPETYRQAAKVVESGTARLIQAMDGAGCPSSQPLSWPTPIPMSRTASWTLTRRRSSKQPKRFAAAGRTASAVTIPVHDTLDPVGNDG
jgi:hypothetical protein